MFGMMILYNYPIIASTNLKHSQVKDPGQERLSSSPALPTNTAHEATTRTSARAYKSDTLFLLFLFLFLLSFFFSLSKSVSTLPHVSRLRKPWPAERGRSQTHALSLPKTPFPIFRRRQASASPNKTTKHKALSRKDECECKRDKQIALLTLVGCFGFEECEEKFIWGTKHILAL